MAVTPVASTTTSTSLLGADSGRGGLIVSNDDANRLYVLLDSGTASVSNYSFYLDTGEASVPIVGYTGEVTGVWAADGTGSARLTTWGR